jgi:CNT family concentrative nucleoside transporter
MVLYAGVLGPIVDGALGHILVASTLNVVGAVVVSRIMVPEQGAGLTADAGELLGYSSNMDAIAQGTADGLRLAANVGAMLIVLVSLVALVNYVISAVEFAGAPLTLERMLGWAFAPVAWLIGVPWSDAQTVGALLGTKLILNELVAYLEFAALGPDAVSPHSRLVTTYALCSFANFGSLGIMLGGLATLIPERRHEFLALGPKTLVSGTIVTSTTAALVGLVSLV